MRILTIIVAVVAMLYSGLWFGASRFAQNGAVTLVDDLRADGWDISYADLSVRGFPSRLDTTVTDLSLARDGIGWQAPFLQVFALAYRPNQVIAVWPPEQVVTVPGDRFVVASDGLRASAAVAASTALALDHATVESGPLTVTADSGWSVQVAALLAAFRQGGPTPADYDIFVRGTDVILTGPVAARLQLASTGDARLPLFQMDLGLTLTAPLDRFASGPAQITALTLRGLTVDGGDVGLTGAGDLTVDDQGIPTGRITLSLRNWARAIDIALAAGLVDPAQGPLLRNMAETLAAGSDTLDLPITFDGGMMSVSFLPLGPAPRLR